MRQILTLMTLLVAGCSASAAPPSLPSDYEASVRGLFLDGSKKMCRANLVNIGQKPQDTIDKLWHDRKGANYIFVGVKGGRDGRITLASPDLCTSLGRDKMSSRMKRIFPSATIQEPEEFILFNTGDELEKLGLNSVDLSFKNMHGPCHLVRDIKYDIGINRLFDIRYRLSVPIVYYNSAHGKEVFIFDGGCNRKNEYLDIIDFYNSRDAIPT